MARKPKKCFCGHRRDKHVCYSDNGRNSKGSIYVCTADNCHRWNLCDLNKLKPHPKAAEAIKPNRKGA